MVSLKQRTSGFTIVELLIVIVIIGILAGLVITTFVGIQQRARNSERQTDINSVASQLEGYFASHSSYPNLNDLNSETFRDGNGLKMGDNSKALADPSNAGSADLVGSVPADNAARSYVYQTSPATCDSPTNAAGESTTAATPCEGFRLTAVMENAGNYVKDGANNTSGMTF